MKPRMVSVCLWLMLWGMGCAVSRLETRNPSPLIPPSEKISTEDVKLDTLTQSPPSLAIEEIYPENCIPAAWQGERYTIKFRAADIQDVLIALATQSGINIVFGEEIRGTVSVNLFEVTFLEVIDSLLRTLEYSYRIEGNIVRIIKHDTRMFRLNYVFADSSSKGSRRGTGTGSSAKSDQQGDFWTDVETAVNSLVSSNGEVVVDSLSGLIIVTDTTDALHRVERFLSALQSVANRQVIIEAKIVDVTLDDEYQLGINWDAANLGFSSINSNTSGSISQNFGNPTGFMRFTITSDHITALLDALGNQGQLEVISSPRITTMNNQEAYIDVSEEIPYYTAEISVQTGEVLGWNVEFRKAGVIFVVTPQISENGQIMIRVTPRVSELVGYTDPGRAEPVPIIEVREVSTVISVLDGQTVVLGGLNRKKKLESVSMIPGLGNLPFIGKLFRKTVQTLKNTELVLLLTPHLVSEYSQYDEISQSYREQQELIRRGFHLGILHPIFSEE